MNLILFPALLLQSMVTQHVLIELPGAEPRLLAAAENGCRRALGSDNCMASAGAATGHFDHRVRVLWDSQGLHAVLEFYPIPPGDQAGSNAATRELTFSEADGDEARYEAVGLVVAAYLIGQASAATPELAIPVKSLELSAPPEPGRPRWAADLLGGLGPGLSRGKARLLGGVRGLVRPFGAPVFLMAQLEAAHRFDSLPATWLSVGVGIAVWVPTPVPRLHLSANLVAAFERFSASAIHPENGELDSGSDSRLGPRAGLEAHLCFGGNLCVFVGARLGFLYPAIRLEFLGKDAGRQAPLSLQGLLGIRIAG